MKRSSFMVVYIDFRWRLWIRRHPRTSLFLRPRTPSSSRTTKLISCRTTSTRSPFLRIRFNLRSRTRRSETSTLLSASLTLNTLRTVRKRASLHISPSTTPFSPRTSSTSRGRRLSHSPRQQPFPSSRKRSGLTIRVETNSLEVCGFKV